MRSIPTMLAELQRLCNFLNPPSPVSVVTTADERWAWCPQDREITVPERALVTRGTAYCSGVLSHEVGHVFLTRYECLASTATDRDKMRFRFLNGIEDPRVNTWMIERYPGVAEWHREMAKLDIGPIATPMLLTSRFLLECAREQYIQWEPASTVGPVPAEVHFALESTRAARRAYAHTTPPADLSLAGTYQQIVQDYHRRIAKSGRATFPSEVADAWEQQARLCQLDALELAEREIIPAFNRLIDLDVARIAAYLRQSPACRAPIVLVLQEKECPVNFDWDSLAGKILAFQAEAGSFPTPTPGERHLATRILERLTSGERQDGATLPGRNLNKPCDPTPPPPKSASSRRRLRRVSSSPFCKAPTIPQPSYADMRDRLHSQIERLSRELTDLFQPRRRMREQTGMRTGSRVDMRRLIALETNPRLYDRLWKRKTLPDRRDWAVSLLVDLSGSMNSHGRIEAALAGTILLAEVLHRQGVSFAINGFQDELIPFHGFRDPYGPAVASHLEGMASEVRNTRPGGHNRSHSNFDGPCLEKAAEQLVAHAATDRVLIVISDGSPSGPGNDGTAELQKAIAAVQELRPRVNLIGLGLGKSTSHVADHYPRAKACIPEADLAAEIAALLRDTLTDQPGEFAVLETKVASHKASPSKARTDVPF